MNTITSGLANWKTTTTVIIGAICSVINFFLKTEIPQDAITAVVIFIVGFFAKDATTGSQPVSTPTVTTPPAPQG